MLLARRLGLPTAAALSTLMMLGCASGAESTGPSASSSAVDRSSTATRSISQSTSQSPSQTTGQSVSQSASQSASQSDSQSAAESSSASSSAAASGTRTALFFGDSNFVGGGCTPYANRDMAQIAGNQLGYRSAIRGQGGTGFASGNSDYDLPNYVVQVRQGALNVYPAPRLVVIEGGANDTGFPLAHIARAARMVLRTAMTKYPAALVVLMGPIDIRAGHGDVSPRVVDALRSAAASARVPFLDAYSWLPWRTTGGLVCSDYDHATPAGHRILGTKLASALRRLGA